MPRPAPSHATAIAASYGVDRDFWRAPNAVYDQLIPSLDLDPLPGYLLLFLIRHIIGYQLYDKGVAITVKTIGTRLRMSVPTVRKAIATLEEKGLIVVSRDKVGSGMGFPMTQRIYLTPPSRWSALCNDVAQERDLLCNDVS